MVQEAASEISTDIKNYIEENGFNTGKAKRVNYLEMVHSLGDGHSPAEIAETTGLLEERGRAVYVSGLRKIVGNKEQLPDLGEEAQSGCLYLLID